MKNKPIFALLFGAFCSSFGLAGCAQAQTQTQTAAAPRNIALHQPVTLSPGPSYKYMKSREPAQLTDGKRVGSKGLLWTQLGGITWSYINPVTITVDLGSVQPICGASFSTASNEPSGIHWPESIRVAVSEDAKQWHYIGDLVKDSPAPPDNKNGYATFLYKTTNWHTKGRYVTFGISQKLFTVADEVGVFRGQGAWLNQPAGGIEISSMKELAQREITTKYAKKRISGDIARVRSEVQSSPISGDRKRSLLMELDKSAIGIKKMALLPADFRSTFPFNDIHRTAFSVYGELLKSQGFAPITLWQKPRYEWLPLFAKPEKTQHGLHYFMLGNQHRSDAFLLTNATADAITVNLTIKDAPAEAKPGWLQVAQVEFTDTSENVAVADALVPISGDTSGQYPIVVPPGLTRKVWFTVNSSNVPAGTYQSSIVIKSPEKETVVPLSLKVAELDMQKPRLSLAMWDYSATNGGNSYSSITKQNKAELIDMMRSHYVDTAWGTEWGTHFASLVKASDFDANNKLIHPDFSKLKQWHENWPDARRYFVFLGSAEANPAFAGAKMGTPEFKARLSNWAKALTAYLPTIGIKPEQLGLCIVDETHEEATDAIIVAWTKVLKAAAPQLQIFSDPSWRTPQSNKNQAALKLPDIICVKPHRYFKDKAETRQYFDSLQQDGTQLWFYQCSGPVRMFAPQHYYRNQAWLAFAAGAKGQGFWSFTDTGKSQSSWNEYGISRPNFAPAFIAKSSVNSSLHLEAIRDGMQDNEELAMLKDAIADCKDATLKAKAQQVLKNAVSAVVDDWKTVSGLTSEDSSKLPAYRAQFKQYRRVTLRDWRLDHDATVADQQIAKVREMIIELHQQHIDN